MTFRYLEIILLRNIFWMHTPWSNIETCTKQQYVQSEAGHTKNASSEMVEKKHIPG